MVCFFLFSPVRPFTPRHLTFGLWCALCFLRVYAVRFLHGHSLKAYGLASDRYTFCQKCFNDIQGDTVTLGDDPTQAQT